MSKLGELCRACTRLNEEDIFILENAERMLPVIAQLINGDVFIDCMGIDGVAIVVAEGKPEKAYSQYTMAVVGERAHIENEPAVYHSFFNGVPTHDIKAVTQQNKTVMQDVSPIFNEVAEPIGVLILERDYTRQLLLEEKLAALDEETFTEHEAPSRDVQLYIREAHHRIKNNLQMLVSITNMRLRQENNREVKTALRENANTVLAVAALHDILSESGAASMRQPVPLQRLLRKVVDGIAALCDTRRIVIRLACEDVAVRQERAVPIALVVNELVTNALEHAFDGKERGLITVTLTKGARYVTIMIEDDGSGIPHTGGKGLGLQLASITVEEKLDGELSVVSGERGTKAVFRFLP